MSSGRRSSRIKAKAQAQQMSLGLQEEDIASQEEIGAVEVSSLEESGGDFILQVISDRPAHVQAQSSKRGAANYFDEFSNGYTLKWEEFSHRFQPFQLSARDLAKLRDAYKKRKYRKGLQTSPENKLQELSKALDEGLPASVKLNLETSLDKNLEYQEKLALVKAHIASLIASIKILQPIDNILNVLNQINENSKLKATLTLALRLFRGTQFQKSDYLTYFSRVIAPYLNNKARLEYIEKGEAQILSEISSSFNISSLSDSQATIFIKILGHYMLFDLTEGYNQLREKPVSFWKDILCDYFHLAKECFDIWIAHPAKFFRKEVLYHHSNFTMSVSFCKVLTKMAVTLTQGDLLEMFTMSTRPNFNILMSLVPENSSYSYITIQNNFWHYLNNTDPTFINSFKGLLAGKPVQDWHRYANAVQNYDLQGTDAAKKVEAVFKLECRWGNDVQLPSSKAQPSVLKDAYWTLNSKYPTTTYGWQKALLKNLWHLIVENEAKYFLIQIGTGHGKSIIIQLLALCLLRHFKKDVHVVCLNEYLACQSRMKYNNQLQIKYKSIDEFLHTPPSSKNFVIFDEVDQMLGTESFQVNQFFANNDKKAEAIYLPSKFAQWGGVIAFSGTLSESYLGQFRTDFKGALAFQFPSFRVNGDVQEIKKVVKLERPLNETLKAELTLAQKDFKNVIILFKYPEQLDSFESLLAQNARKTFKVFVFKGFQDNHGRTLTKLEELLEDNWVVLATRDGSRGTDFKGTSPAHVIVAYQPETYSDCVQALGRGARGLDQGSSGTVICSEPVTTDPKTYLRALKAQEDEVSEVLLQNIKVAKRFHGFEAKTQQEVDNLIHLQVQLETNVSFKSKADLESQSLWQKLRLMVNCERFPETPFHSDSAFVTPSSSQEQF